MAGWQKRKLLCWCVLLLFSIFYLAIKTPGGTKDSLHVPKSKYLKQYSEALVKGNPASAVPTEHRMRDRTATLKRFCHTHPQYTSSTLLRVKWWLLTFSDNIIVIDKFKLVLCFIAKVSSSAMRYKLCELLGHEGLCDLQSVGVRFLSSYNEKDKDFILSNYYKVATVRNPLVRILSSYLDKMAHPKIRFFHVMSWYIGKSSRVWSPYTASSSNIDRAHGLDSWKPTFDEFVYYITHGWWMNVHWMPMVELSRACEIEYNLILHLETFDQDLDYLWTKVLNHTQAFLAINVKNAAGSFLEYYKQMPDELFEVLVNYLSDDFEAFGYEL